MPYSESLAERMRPLFSEQPNYNERKMFGGLAFMVNGHMCCGVMEDRIMVRVGPDAHDAMLAQPHASPMDFTGKPLRGMVYVDIAGLETAEQLSTWVQHSLDFVLLLPPK